MKGVAMKEWECTTAERSYTYIGLNRNKLYRHILNLYFEGEMGMADIYHDIFYNVKDFNITGDAKTLNTEAINNIIKTCSEAGGGTIIFPAGQYLTGPVQLLSNITIYLDAGAVILGSTDINDYFIARSSVESARIGLIYARDAKNISILGKGIIDCQGTAFMDMNTPKSGGDFDRRFIRQGDNYMRFENGIQDGPVEPLDRPGNLIQFLGCENVTLGDITIMNGPTWTVHFGNSKNIVVSGISIINNPMIPNSDGIHCTLCKNVRISDCNIEAGDDAIALTAFGEPGEKTENLVVINCTLSSRSAGVRVGYSSCDIENCIFQNLIINSNRGLGVFQRNEGNISNIIFSNIVINTRLHTGHWWGHGEPIHVSTIHNVGVTKLGTIKNVRFSNIFAKSETGILVHGCEESEIEDLAFDNIRLTITPSPLAKSYGGNFDLRPADRAEKGLFKHEEYGFYAQYVKDMSIRDFTLKWEGDVADYFEKDMEFKDCKNVNIDRYRGVQPYRRRDNNE
jgi:hypothetical protein